jgi:hypothetical protein
MEDLHLRIETQKQKDYKNGMELMDRVLATVRRQNILENVLEITVSFVSHNVSCGIQKKQ